MLQDRLQWTNVYEAILLAVESAEANLIVHVVHYVTANRLHEQDVKDQPVPSTASWMN